MTITKASPYLFFIGDIFFIGVLGGAFRPAELGDRLTARGFCGRNQFD